jgi:amidase
MRGYQNREDRGSGQSEPTETTGKSDAGSTNSRNFESELLFETSPTGSAMSWDQWSTHDDIGLAELLKTKQVTPHELAEQAARALDLMDSRLNFLIEIFWDVVEDPYQDGMNADGPFRGVPLLVKDNGSKLKGRAQALGTALVRGNLSGYDDPLTTNRRRGGLNLLGRTPPHALCVEYGYAFRDVGNHPQSLLVGLLCGRVSRGAAAVVASGVVPAWQ